MADKIDTSKIRPARGLWAAVRPDGTVYPMSLASTEAGACSEAAWLQCYDDWHALAALSWRIVRVDVVPHEENSDE